MKKFSLLVLLMVVFVLCNAQPEIKFDQTTYNFGAIHEEAGKVIGRFEFTNIGDSALVLTKVRPGCGCTPASYTREPVAPGGRGYIDISYNPYNRPGGFNKVVRITTNEPKFRGEKPAAPYNIFIKGEVIKRPPTMFEKAGYTKSPGMARFKEPNIRLDILNTKSKTDTFRVHNFWTKPVTYTLQNPPAYISETYRNFGKELQPGKDGIIVLKYDASKRGAYGLVKDNFVYVTNDSIEPKKRLYYTVNIKEDFSVLSKKQIKNAPVASLNVMEYDFGKVQRNSRKNTTVTITNNGKDMLYIRQLSPSSGNYSATSDKMEIAAGQSATITITFKAGGRVGMQKATIDVITNDPNAPEQVINLKGQIQ